MDFFFLSSVSFFPSDVWEKNRRGIDKMAANWHQKEKTKGRGGGGGYHHHYRSRLQTKRKKRENEAVSSFGNCFLLPFPKKTKLKRVFSSFRVCVLPFLRIYFHK